MGKVGGRPPKCNNKSGLGTKLQKKRTLARYSLGPVFPIGGIVFLVKAGMLSGEFYIAGAVLFLTAVPMALFPRYGPLMFGLVTSICFFVPGLKYHRQRLRSARRQP